MGRVLLYLKGIWLALVSLARAICYLDEVDPLGLHTGEKKTKRKPKKTK